MAQQVLQNRIPQPNAALPSAMLLLFSAMGHSGVSEWLGNDTVYRLERAGRRDIVAKLVDEFQQAGGSARDAVVGEWRSYPIPLHNLQQFQTLQLYVHQDGDQRQQGGSAGTSNESAKTRFLIDLNMTRLGAMQMDGLSQSKKLDMIVRSERPLPDDLPDELRGLYISTLGAVGYTGSINFQTGRRNWLVVQREAKIAGVTT
jgi:hypothetical protein